MFSNIIVKVIARLISVVTIVKHITKAYVLRIWHTYASHFGGGQPGGVFWANQDQYRGGWAEYCAYLVELAAADSEIQGISYDSFIGFWWHKRSLSSL